MSRCPDAAVSAAKLVAEAYASRRNSGLARTDAVVETLLALIDPGAASVARLGSAGSLRLVGPPEAGMGPAIVVVFVDGREVSLGWLGALLADELEFAARSLGWRVEAAEFPRDERPAECPSCRGNGIVTDMSNVIFPRRRTLRYPCGVCRGSGVAHGSARGDQEAPCP